jgi:hypothetical protein
MERELNSNANANIKTIVAISAYFIAFIVYLYFFRIEKNIDIAFFFKPLIIPSIAFAYFFSTKNPFYFINLFIFLIIYFADNLILLEDRALYAFSTFLYLITTAFLVHYVVIDSKIFEKKPILLNTYPYLLLGILLSILVLKIYDYIYGKQYKEAVLVGFYISLFLSLLLLSLYNAIKNKSKASLFLLGAILSLFLSDVLIGMNVYYFKSEAFIYIASLLEIPVYYLLFRYFLHREEVA